MRFRRSSARRSAIVCNPNWLRQTSKSRAGTSDGLATNESVSDATKNGRLPTGQAAIFFQTIGQADRAAGAKSRQKLRLDFGDAVVGSDKSLKEALVLVPELERVESEEMQDRRLKVGHADFGAGRPIAKVVGLAENDSRFDPRRLP